MLLEQKVGYGRHATHILKGLDAPRESSRPLGVMKIHQYPVSKTLVFRILVSQRLGFRILFSKTGFQDVDLPKAGFNIDGFLGSSWSDSLPGLVRSQMTSEGPTKMRYASFRLIQELL